MTSMLADRTWSALNRVVAAPDDPHHAEERARLTHLGSLFLEVLRSGEINDVELAEVTELDADLVVMLAGMSMIWKLNDDTGISSTSLLEAMRVPRVQQE